MRIGEIEVLPVFDGFGYEVARAIGLAFAREGARVAFHCNSSAQGAEKAAAEVAAGGQAITVRADLRDDAAVNDAADTAENQLGPRSILVNNAAATRRQRFLDSSPADHRSDHFRQRRVRDAVRETG